MHHRQAPTATSILLSADDFKTVSQNTLPDDRKEMVPWLKVAHLRLVLG